MFGLFVCRSEHVDERGRASGPHLRENAPGWPIIFGFTIVFLATYPLHMYVAEVYLSDPGSSFAFLIAKVSYLYREKRQVIYMNYTNPGYLLYSCLLYHTFFYSIALVSSTSYSFQS